MRRDNKATSKAVLRFYLNGVRSHPRDSVIFLFLSGSVTYILDITWESSREPLSQPVQEGESRAGASATIIDLRIAAAAAATTAVQSRSSVELIAEIPTCPVNELPQPTSYTEARASDHARVLRGGGYNEGAQ